MASLLTSRRVIGLDAPGRRPSLLWWGPTAAIAYFALAQIGHALGREPGGVLTAIWPPSAIAFVAVLAGGMAALPFLLVADVATSISIGIDWPLAVLLAFATILEPAIAVAILRRARFGSALSRTGDVLRLAGAAALAAGVSAFIGVELLVVGGLTTQDEVGAAWALWASSDLLAILLLAPVFLIAPHVRVGSIPRERWIEGLAFLAATVVSVAAAFGVGGFQPRLFITFLLAPLLALAAFRLGPAGVAVILPVMVVLGIVATSRGMGPFAPDGFIALQAFLAGQGGLALMLAAAVASHRASERALRAQTQGLALAVAERTQELERANRDLAERVKDLQTTNEELEAFSYSASHDLRAPLRGIDVLSEVLIEDEGTRLSEQGRQQLERLRREARRMSMLIEGLTALSRAGSVDLAPRDVDVSRLAREVWGELAAADPARDVAFAPEEGIRVNADPELLRVVLSNLLSNAWKYTGGEPEARVDVASVQVDGFRGFEVRDNGIGFDPVRSTELFRPFRRLVDDARRFEGTGVGLSTVKRIVERHGGHVTARGSPGEGATFTVLLPG